MQKISDELCCERYTADQLADLAHAARSCGATVVPAPAIVSRNCAPGQIGASMINDLGNQLCHREHVIEGQCLSSPTITKAKFAICSRYMNAVKN